MVSIPVFYHNYCLRGALFLSFPLILSHILLFLPLLSPGRKQCKTFFICIINSSLQVEGKLFRESCRQERLSGLTHCSLLWIRRNNSNQIKDSIKQPSSNLHFLPVKWKVKHCLKLLSTTNLFGLFSVHKTMSVHFPFV